MGDRFRGAVAVAMLAMLAMKPVWAGEARWKVVECRAGELATRVLWKKATVRLTDGTELRGRIRGVKGEEWSLRVGGRRFRLSEVERVRFRGRVGAGETVATAVLMVPGMYGFATATAAGVVLGAASWGAAFAAFWWFDSRKPWVEVKVMR